MNAATVSLFACESRTNDADDDDCESKFNFDATNWHHFP